MNVVIQLLQNSSKDSKMQDFAKNDSKLNGRWTKEEHLKFLEGLHIYGKNWKKIEQLVQTRSGSQIRSHAQKFFLKNKTSDALYSNDFCPESGEDQLEAEQITRNSKSFAEGNFKREDLSYYFVKIVQYSSGKSTLNFWEGLVDCKDATDISHQPSRKNSFTNFGDEQSSSDLQESPRKKIKV